MLSPHPPTVQPKPPVKFRRSLVILVLALGLGGVAYILMDSDDPGERPAAAVPASTLKPPLAGAVAELPKGYRDLPMEEPPPPPQEPAPQEPAAPPSQPPAASGQTQTPTSGQKTATGQTTPRHTQAKPAEPKRWLIAKTNVQKAPFERPKAPPVAPEELALLKPAKWVQPVHPEQVLYPEQVIPAIMLQALNSDVPGTLRFMVTENVMDLQTGTTVLIPQFSTIMGHWDEQPKYGQAQAHIKVASLRLFGSGTLVDLTGGSVGATDGSNGIPAHVDNHYVQLGVAALLSAAFSIGPRVAAGSQIGYAPSLPQEFANQAATSFNQAGQDIIKRQLMRAPTLTREAGYPVTIQLKEAVSFQQPPRRTAK